VVREVGEGAGSSPVGSGSGQRHRRGAVHGGAARRRGYSTPASNQEQQRAKQGAIGAGEVRYLKAGSGDSSAATGTRRGPGATVAAARRTTGERGQREIGRGRGNWGAFRVADARAELTGAKGAAELHRRREIELGTAGLWRRCSACAQRGGERVYWAQMGEGGEGEWGSGLKWPRARWGRVPRATWARGRWARAARRRLRGDDGADSPGPRAERERGSGRARGRRAPTGGAGRAVRERGGCAEGGRADRPGPLRRERRGGRRARERWAGWAERPRGRLGWASLPFSFILNCFSLFFYLFYLIQIQMSPKFKLDLLRIMHQTKVKSRVQHDATIHTPLGFNIINYSYK
jgi:hypothetical protein